MIGVQHLKTVNSNKYVCQEPVESINLSSCKIARAIITLFVTDWLEIDRVDQSHRRQGKAKSMRSIYPIYFRSQLVTNLKSFVFPRNIKWDIYSREVMIYVKPCKSGLTSHSILHILQSYHSHFSNSLYKSAPFLTFNVLLLYTRFLSFLWRVWTNL